MAEEWNSCASLANDESTKEALLEYNKILAQHKDPLKVMMSMQYNLQIALHERLPEQALNVNDLDTIGKKYDWVKENKTAFDDEFSELVDALPGMSMKSKDRSALWKRWKGKYTEVRDINFDDLSDEDKKEAKMEIIDALHFFLNMLIGMGMDSEEIFVYYYLKNAENFRRSNSGY